jgi:hypothetical protein
MRCLLVRTNEKKEFLTACKNYPLLIEYANTFGGRLYTIDTEISVPLLSMNELAEQLCSGEGIRSQVKYEIIKKHLPAAERASKRRDEQKLAGQIRAFIREQLMKGKPVSLISIRRHFSKYGLRTCTVSNHYAFIRKQMKTKGMNVQRVGHGIYQRKD